MAQFTITQIRYDGDVNPEIVIGQHGHTTNVIPKIEKQDDTTARFIITTNFEHEANGKLLYYVRVTSIYTLFKIDLKNLDREVFLLTGLIIQSFGHLQGIIASKYQDKKVPSSPPHDPDFKPAIEEAKKQFLSAFRK